ncbi:energy-coupling factor transporter transmembrane protein EcfT [Thermosynechococcaceae cyanobacterium BACA0444]|uniref:Energy-coupling factor transporter transmembrane protein EcfT n=1 Tax=Pseudocalidococcus azoricus BACA0444 TaxID=2918990 RepID=A0AAE4JWH8_9CYAN|nr:energy-coupling factor transporter transmembrane protein EcfT [Pseudocalidococcus azoricus]MDS3861390.1 energy-coupling factor transporter transmembrane protein EcfT [Pseudocalidococcus azoricus BACA0444]
MDLLRSLPLGLYLEQPVTWLHRLDPRLKLAWLMTFLLSPLMADSLWRLLLVGLLLLLTALARIPLRAFGRQLVWLVVVGSLILVITSFMPDGFALSYQPRQITPETIPTTDYNYVLWSHPPLWPGQGPLQITRRSLELGIRLSTLLFTLIYGTSLYLLTTAPEEITAGLEALMLPLRAFKVPVTEVALTLTLSLRFIPLVLEEIQNLGRSIRTRAIDWRKLGLGGAIKIWVMLAGRILENLLLRAEQVAGAMQVRGFTQASDYRNQWQALQWRGRDWLALAVMGLVLVGRVMLPNYLKLS